MKFLENLAIFLIMIIALLAGIAVIIFFGVLIVTALSGLLSLLF